MPHSALMRVNPGGAPSMAASSAAVISVRSGASFFATDDVVADTSIGSVFGGWVGPWPIATDDVVADTTIEPTLIARTADISAAATPGHSLSNAPSAVTDSIARQRATVV